jgi:4-methyl-5(b-hydroxyethyl)-thiazole monophosphate biosynthesis
MPKTVLVPLADGFEEIEAATIIDVLRRAGVDVTVAALRGHPVRGAHGIGIAADVTLAEVERRRFDAVVLPGGMPGAANLRDDPRVTAALCDVVKRGGTAAAICAAPIALEAAGLLKGRRATAYPGFREELGSASDRVSDRVVSDGPIVTSAGPGTAMEFALALVERLVSKETADKLRDAMLVSA